MEPQPKPQMTAQPSWIDLPWYFPGETGPVGKAMRSYFQDDGKTWRASKVVVTVMLDSAQGTTGVAAEGFPLTKAGKRDARNTSPQAMFLDEATEINFIEAALKLLAPDLVKNLKV